MDIHILTNEYRRIDPWFERGGKLPLELDLGCGKGGFLLNLAARFPDRLVVGADVMLGRLRRVAAKAARQQLANLELLRADSLELLTFQLPDKCVMRLHVLCPDPWPKTRHRWRRLVTSDFLVRAGRVMMPGGVIHLATDDREYFESMLKAADSTGILLRDHELTSLKDIVDVQTDFEKQWRAKGRGVPHAAFRIISAD